MIKFQRIAPPGTTAATHVSSNMERLPDVLKWRASVKERPLVKRSRPRSQRFLKVAPSGTMAAITVESCPAVNWAAPECFARRKSNLSANIGKMVKSRVLWIISHLIDF